MLSSVHGIGVYSGACKLIKEEGLGMRLSAFYEHQQSTKRDPGKGGHINWTNGGTIWKFISNAAAVFGIKISLLLSNECNEP